MKNIKHNKTIFSFIFCLICYFTAFGGAKEVIDYFLSIPTLKSAYSGPLKTSTDILSKYSGKLDACLYEQFEKNVLGQCVLVSGAFFPFDDNIELAHKHDINYIVQPGGSKKDNEVIDKCNQYRISMVFIGLRHFKH